MPLLAALGLGAPPESRRSRGSLRRSGSARRGVWLPRLAGTAAGAKITGHLAWRLPVEPIAASSIDPDVALAQSIAGEPQGAPTAQIDGQLSFDHASLAALLSLPLGVPQPAKPGVKWSEAKFASPLVDPPPLDVRLNIGALDIVDAMQAHGATARVKMDRGRFDIDEFAMELAGGRASGRVALRRDGAIATLTGQTAFDAVAVDRAGLHGRVDAALAFASTGQSPGALVAGLVGEGHVEIAGVAIPRLDPGRVGPRPRQGAGAGREHRRDQYRACARRRVRQAADEPSRREGAGGNQRRRRPRRPGQYRGAGRRRLRQRRF